MPLGKSLFQHSDALFGFDFVNAASMWTVAVWDPQPRNLATTGDREDERQTHVFRWRGRNPDTPSCTERIWPHPGTESKPFWYPPPELLSPEEAKTHRWHQHWGYRSSWLKYRNIMIKIKNKNLLIEVDNKDFFTCAQLQQRNLLVQTELTLRLRHTSPAVLISWMA